MSKPDFMTMTKPELRAYVIAHPDDRQAFHAFVDRFTADASSQVFDIPSSPLEIQDVERLIRQKLAQINPSET
ncbi:MAG: hypothetical protein NW220_05430 [Leptolyngbyaceae cyanobacterium bins.349]|nr:hypothetical protein [Leptolyngbyaceae cyanobacterium bins.349]